MVFGRKIRLQTDHVPLLRIFRSKKGTPMYAANRLERLITYVRLHDRICVATEMFGQVDVLSRLINQHVKPDAVYVLACSLAKVLITLLNYLLVVDSFSKCPEIVQISRITAVATIMTLRSIFAWLGMPETVVSDNGTQFTSAEFAEFCCINGIQHVITAPFHPQSNGQVERFV